MLKTFLQFINESLENKEFYHGNRKGDFPPEKRRFAGGAIFLTDNLEFAKDFAGLKDESEKQPNSSVFKIILKDNLKFCNPMDIETMKEIKILDVIKKMIETNFKDTNGDIDMSKSLNGEFKGFNYEKEFDIKLTPNNKENYAYFYLWRIKNGSWRLIETEPIINAIKEKGYDGFYIVERGSKNLAIFDENNIESFKKIL